MTQHEMEHLWGLTEVVMIRLPVEDWASEADVAALTAIAETDPLHEDWPIRQHAVARKSAGFTRWLRDLAAGKWKPRGEASDRVMERLAKVDFSLPWCARLRWGARYLKTVDVFIHATGNTDHIKWETISDPG
jgi:hypothetical protein